MNVRRFAIATAAAAAVILSAPFAQQAFTAMGTAWPSQLRTIAIAATAIPVGAVFLFAYFRIRDRRAPRYLALALGLGIGGGYIILTGLSYGESFHFVEYGLLALLFYRAWRPIDDGSVILLPLLAGALAGTLDEWFQWFIPIRAGEARDVGLNTIALACGLLFAIAVNPPGRERLAIRRESWTRVGGWAAALVIVFALFFQSVHLGYDIRDEEAGTFRSRYAPNDLASVGLARAERWRDRPPLVQRRVAREDQYLTEGLRHVQRRNAVWGTGDAFAAWHENRILEKFYAPVLDTPSYASASGHRWPAEQRAAAERGATAQQRAAAEARASGDLRAYVSDAQPFPVYAWPKPLFWTAHLLLVVLISVLCRRYSF